MKMDVPKRTKADFEAELFRKRVKCIKRDIRMINDALESGTDDDIIETHRAIDGKYQSYVQDWGNGMLFFVPKMGFDYNNLYAEAARDNLKLMKAKIDGFKCFSDEQSTVPMNNVSVNNTIVNQNTVTSFQEVQQNIYGLSDLSANQKDEIKDRLDVLESILNSDDKKESKWDKAKPILKELLDKSFEAAKIAVPYFLQNLG